MSGKGPTLYGRFALLLPVVDMQPCPGCGTEMREAFKGSALVYYVCGGCGLSKMDVQGAVAPPMPPQQQPKPTGLVCVQCNQPFAVIERDAADTFDLRCQRCGHRWTIPTSEPTRAPEIH